MTGLTNGTTYTFTVTAHNAVGTSTPPADESGSTTATPATLPENPALDSVVVGTHSATITWLKPANGGSPILGYTVTATPGGLTCSTDSADELSCTITGLTDGVNYTFTVTARNAVGTSVPPTDTDPGSGGSPGTGTGTPGTPPSPVTGVTPEHDPGDGTQVTIHWLAADSDLPIIGYRATAEPGGHYCETTGELFCTITGLDPATDYSFTVVAINASGSSDPSDPVDLPADTTPPTVTASSDRDPVTEGSTQWFDGPVTVTWVVTDNDGGSGVPADNVPDPVEVTASGAVSSGSVCDAAGNCTTASVDIGIDTTGPHVVIGGVIADTKYPLGSAPTPTCTATDSHSGLAGDCTLTAAGGNTNGVGTYTATAAASDKVGNTTTTTVEYKMVYTWDGFLPPITSPGHQDGDVSVFKAGSTVPVKFTLTGPDGQPIAPVTAPVWTTPQQGAPTDSPVDQSAYSDPGDSGTAFRLTDDQWKYNWKTAKNQAGYYWRIGVRLDDGETHYVDIALN